MAENGRLVLFFEALADGDFALTLDGRRVLSFSSDGLRGRILDGAANAVDRDDLVRWGVPAAVAPQGITCLHGSAVQTEHGLIAILGNGGAGKSTLARLLGEGPWKAVADDLLLLDDAGRVDLASEPAVRAWVGPASAFDDIDYQELLSLLSDLPRDWQPVRLVVVLGERILPSLGDSDMSTCNDETWGDPSPAFTVQSVPPLPAVTDIALHRFGGHPSPAAWGAQLRDISALVDRAVVVRLREPEGLEALRTALPEIIAALKDLFEPATSEASARP